MRTRIPFPRRSALLLLCGSVFALGLTGCDLFGAEDDPHDDDHSEAHGVRLVLNGVTVYQILEGTVTCAQEPCGIDVTEGEETALIAVEFLNEEGEEIHDDDLDAEYGLGYEIANTAVAEFEQHAEDGRFNFHVHGEAAGTTAIRLDLLHDDHADFSTPPLTNADAIAVRVTAP